MTFFRLILDNIWRNPLRTILTSVGTMMMVLVVVMILSVITFLADTTRDKARNLKAIVTERWQIPSQMPWAYAETLKTGAPHKPNDITIAPQDAMTWSFYGGATDPDPKKRSMNTILFAFSQEPDTLLGMMDELEDLKGKEREEFAAVVEKFRQNKQAIILGKERMKMLDKQVGDTLKIYSFNYKGIDLEFDIVGTYPIPRYDLNASMRSDYLQDALDQWSRENRNQKHAMAERSLNLVWLRVPDRATFNQVSHQIVTNPSFSSPSVKIETASSAIGNFLEAYSTLIWGATWLLTPAILFTLSLVIANSISISVRERRLEFAVLKVLGFRPWHILVMVLGEALLVGGLSGLVSAGGTYLFVNDVLGGLQFRIGFFGAFLISQHAWWWGLAMGAGTAFLGSIWPAWSARTVRVADVFAKIA